jgi:hypothetical protein
MSVVHACLVNRVTSTLRRWLAVAFVGLLGLGAASPARADFVTLTLTQANSSSGLGTGNFGMVTLTLDQINHSVNIDVNLADGFLIISTGFSGAFGFGDSLGGGLTIGDFNNSSYSGGTRSDVSDSQHFDGFGYQISSEGLCLCFR